MVRPFNPTIIIEGDTCGNKEHPEPLYSSYLVGLLLSKANSEQILNLPPSLLFELELIIQNVFLSGVPHPQFRSNRIRARSRMGKGGFWIQFPASLTIE